VLKEHGATQGIVRCRPNYLPIQEAMRQLNEGRREAFEEPPAYEAQVFVTPAGVEFLKKSTTLEIAPVGGSANPAKGKKGQNAPQP
jgi:hypothetical protein